MSEFGQINETTDRWKLIQKTIKNNNFNTIVEIGTWKGMGSTLAILTEKKENTYFITIESNYEFHNIAKNNLKNFENNFKMLYGRIVEKEQVISFIKEYDLTDEQKTWLNEDILNFEKCPNILKELPEKIDFLILDGGEFSTYEEWKILKEKVHFVGLDDINVLKCKKIVEELSSDNNYKLIEVTNEGNGFCVFERL
jgi:hypothetical protein